jgi:hypothetical protein
MTGIIFGRKGANLRTISPIDDKKDQSFQESFKRLRSLLIGQILLVWRRSFDAGALENALERGLRDRSHQAADQLGERAGDALWRSVAI